MASETASSGEFNRGGTVVFACFVGMMLGISAVPFYTLGAFAKPMTTEFGWSMEQFQRAFSFMLAGAFMGPIAGHLMDKHGVRPVALVCTICFALCLIALGLITTANTMSFYAGWAAMAITGQGTGPIAWTRAINGWFIKHRGLALGLALTGSGLFAAIGPPLAVWLIDSFGWRQAYMMLGGLVLVVALPILFLFLRDAPADLHATSGADEHGLTAAHGVSFGEAIRNYRFWIIFVSFFFISLGVSGVIANLIPLLGEKGFDRATAAGYASLIGISVVAGRIVVGFLLDRFWGPGIAFVLLALPAISCLILAGGTLPHIAVGIAVFIVGFAAGAEFDIIAYFTARYFGLKNYGKIYGVQYLGFGAGAAVAPPIFGRVFDSQGSYDPILTIAAFMFIGASALLLLLGRYPQLKTAEATA
jgi:MFS transporter, OFA family, oxalate/formate antiporter